MGVGFIVLIILAIVGLVLGIMSLFLIPPIFKELKYITMLYYKMELKKAIARHIVHFIVFLPLLSIMLYVLYINEYSIVDLVVFLLFLLSAFVGFYIFLYFMYALSDKNSKKIFLSLFLGGAVFVVFAPSAYYSLSPMYNYMQTDEYKESGIYDDCHDKEDWLVGGECTSRDLTLEDVVGKWQMQNNRDVSSKENYFLLLSNGQVRFHGYYVVPSGGYDYIKYIDLNSTWSLELKGRGLTNFGGKPDERHPFVSIKIDETREITFRFDSRYGTALYLQHQYDDFDAPHYLTYKRIEGLDF